ncbi:type II toxin-antitoxin system HicB family antitoxin [Candidatus Woesearchaeota archaeon]|nr:type II toxin-antitoxin system HicB family antitoxin [Candidatus Woesearchaeota archaeon]
MESQLLLNVIIKQEDKGYSVICPELNVASQGETFEETIINIKEAMELYIETAEELGTLDEVLGQLGLTKEDLKKKSLIPRVVTANVPIYVSIKNEVLVFLDGVEKRLLISI